MNVVAMCTNCTDGRSTNKHRAENMLKCCMLSFGLKWLFIGERGKTETSLIFKAYLGDNIKLTHSLPAI